MHAEKVIQPSCGEAGEGEELESLRMWAWFAIRAAGGKVVVSYDEFFSCQGGATLLWDIDPTTLALTIVAE
jgi:hypothetical protein